MQPTDPSDSHLTDRIGEIRAVKTAIVLVLVALAAVFYPWTLVLAVFAVGYTAYMYRYYRRRIGVYTNTDLTVQHDRLEYGLLGFVGAAAIFLLANQAIFAEEWELGGFLSLPAVDFTDFNALLEEPIVPIAWIALILPVAALSYVGIQFRKRLLVGVDSSAAAVRATIWDGLGRIPIALLWVAVLTLGPVYDVWEPAITEVATQLNIEPQTTVEFAVIFGEAFDPLVIGSLAVSVAAVGSYLFVQRQKYDNLTIPEVIGYRGLLAPFQGSDQVNVIVPVAAYVLYAAAAVTGLGTIPVNDVALVAAVALSVLVGADILAMTTKTIGSLSSTLGENVDAVVVGLVTGAVALPAMGLTVGTESSLATLAVAYPVIAVPAAFGSNWIVSKHVAKQISSYSERVENDWNEFDESTVDRLFIYSDARDNTLRSAAVRGLASSLQAASYRKDDGLTVMNEAIRSNDPDVVHSGLRGISILLRDNRSPETYHQLATAGAPTLIASYLDSDDEQTRVFAAQAAARVYTAELGAAQSVSPDRLNESHISRMNQVVDSNTANPQLMGAVTEYFATLWYMLSTGDEIHATDDRLQRILGSIIWMSDYSDPYTRQKTVFAVTGIPARADEERLDFALDHLESNNEESRYMTAHVVRSSLDRHVDQVETEQLIALLEDPVPSVRRIGAETLASLLDHDADRGPQVRDRLLLHLEENQESPGRAERSVIRTLAKLEPKSLISHPTGPSTIAAYVGEQNQIVAGPAAQLLRSLTESSRGVAQKESVRTAIEQGLTHSSPEVRLACLEAVAVIVDYGITDSRQFVGGLGANLGIDGRNGVLAAVTLSEILETSPDAGLDIVSDLAAGLRNQTAVDTQTIPFLVRGGTVSAVTVEIVEDVVTLDPSHGKPVIEPLLDLATAVDRSTLGSILGVLVVLSEEFPDESQNAVEVAAVGIEDGSMSIRRDAAQVLANVAAYHPEAVEPFVDHLMVTIEDNSSRVRATALVALRNVCTAIPEAIESDIHRIIGRLDDDSAVVRKQAADLISTVADRDPKLIDQEAEAADRLRRLQRDPAVDVDAERLQDASTAIQTGIATDEADEQDKEEIWEPESSDEMGVSGDTKVFEPIGDDFDPEFDDEFDQGGSPEEEADSQEPAPAEVSTDTTDQVAGQETVIEPDQSDDLGEQDTVIASDTSSDPPGETEQAADSGSDTADVGEQDTAIESDEPAADPGDTDEIGDDETVIEDDSTDDVSEQDTVIESETSVDESDNSADELSDKETVIKDDSTDEIGNQETVIDGSDATEDS